MKNYNRRNQSILCWGTAGVYFPSLVSKSQTNPEHGPGMWVCRWQNFGIRSVHSVEMVTQLSLCDRLELNPLLINLERAQAVMSFKSTAANNQTELGFFWLVGLGVPCYLFIYLFIYLFYLFIFPFSSCGISQNHRRMLGQELGFVMKIYHKKYRIAYSEVWEFLPLDFLRVARYE